MASRVLTITIGNDNIKLCDVSYSAQKSIQVLAAVSVPTPASACEDGMVIDIPLMAKTIRETCDANGITTKNVIFCIQSAKIASKEVTTPELKEAKLKQFITTNATEYFPVNIDDYVLAHTVLEPIEEEGIKKTRVMVAAAPVDMVENYYALAEMLGFHVEAVDYTGNATLQFIRFQIDAKPSIVIQMSEDSTLVTILNRNVLQLMRTVPYGKSTIANALMEKREISYDEAMIAMTDTHNALKSSFGEGDYVTDSLRYLVNNISRVMDYYTSKNPQAPIENAYILIEGSKVYGIEKLFSYELNIKVESLDAIRQVAPPPTDGREPVDMTLYIPNVGCTIHPVNFTPRSALEKAKSANSGKYFRLALLVSIFIGVLLVVFPLVSFINKSWEKSELEKQIADKEYIRATADEYYVAKDKYSDAAKFDIQAYSNDDYLMDFIEYLEKEMPSDISITNMSVANGATTMTFTGSSKTTLADFIVKLKENKSISNIYVPSFSESIDASGVVTVSCSMTCSFSDPSLYETGSEETTAEETTTEEAK